MRIVLRVILATVGKRPNNGLFGRAASRKLLFSKKNIVAQFRFVKLHLSKPQDFLSNVLWTDETKVAMLGNNAQEHV